VYLSTQTVVEVDFSAATAAAGFLVVEEAEVVVGFPVLTPIATGFPVLGAVAEAAATAPEDLPATGNGGCFGFSTTNSPAQDG
jgi:hypothetical protein